MKEKKKETKLQELERRIKQLEGWQQYGPSLPTRIPLYPQQYIPNPNLHYHNGMACYQNPCVWC